MQIEINKQDKQLVYQLSNQAGRISKTFFNFPNYDEVFYQTSIKFSFNTVFLAYEEYKMNKIDEMCSF